jgi:hypothetical protein
VASTLSWNSALSCGCRPYTTKRSFHPALQERRAHLLACIREKAPSIGKDLAEQQLIEQLEEGEDHWDGRKKMDVAVGILSDQNTAFKALSFVEKDNELVLPAFEETPRALQHLAQQVLGSLDLCEAKLT